MKQEEKIMSNKELKLNGYCSDCPYAELSFQKVVADLVDEQELVDISVRCEHEMACRRIAQKCKGEWEK